MYLATSCTLTCMWLHLVTEATSHGFLVLACIWLHLVLWPVFGYTCHRRCFAWFPSVSMPFGYTLNFDIVTTLHRVVSQCWRHSIRRPRKPHRRTKHEVDRTTPRGDMTIWNFPNVRSSVVGRSSIYTSSYTDLIYSSLLDRECYVILYYFVCYIIFSILYWIIL